MLRALAGVVFVWGVCVAAAAQDHANCPMAGSHGHRAQVDHRHDDATGVAHEETVHHFLVAKDGGSIRLEVKDSGQVEERDRIREHLQTVARSFAEGDFSLPMLIHDQVPPGVDVMKKRRSAIGYSYAPTELGGVVRISTGDAKALEAVHAFLRFQIRDHGQGTPPSKMGSVLKRPAGSLRSTQLARLAGVSPDTLRHYENKGLLPRATRSPNGYREYPPEACIRVRLVRRAVALGFTLDELARIVKVRDRGGAPCSEVRAIAAGKLALLDERLAELQDARDRLRAVLTHWDVLLARTPSGGRAALLDALEGLVEPGRPSPLVPHALRRKETS